jgi:triacylglycerol lipase
MGGLDARYMISKVCSSAGIDVRGLVTVATPHRGSPLADYLIENSRWPLRLDSWYGVLRRVGFGTEAFAQLTTSYMMHDFNAEIQDDPTVRYFSYGAAMDPAPSIWSPFHMSHRLISSAQGPNDGLVSVESSRWGEYKGTLVGVSHLDLINWSNRMVWAAKRWVGIEQRFNAVAFYLDIADMLAKEGL